MTLPTHRVSYQVEYNILEQALGDDLGARIKMGSIEAALHLRARIHQARKLDRRDNTLAYDEDHPMHGQSVYDKLVCRLRHIDGKVYLYVEQRNAESFDIEPLSDSKGEGEVRLDDDVVIEPLFRRAF